MVAGQTHGSGELAAGALDWSVIGARILQAAALASAMHMAERAGMAAETTEPGSDRLTGGAIPIAVAETSRSSAASD